MKIDRSFVRRLDEDGGDPAIVRSIVDSPTASGSRVVAEGVETVARWRLLRESGCDVAQGYRISRPMPAEQATQWLVERIVRGPAERAGLRAVGLGPHRRRPVAPRAAPPPGREPTAASVG